MLLIIAIFVVLAALAPLLGADSRDGLDWTPNNFWLRRRTRSRDGTSKPRSGFRRIGSHEQTSAGLDAADGCRTAPAAG
jgi:hypothetical protein